ncbi:hypothetical protein B7463_g10573, partial [Scytalidium lignicola]
MGSQGPSPGEDTSRDIHILVTGFGLFRSHAANPSWLIAASLPPTITSAARRIHIHTLPGAVEVSYHRIRATIPGLLFPKDSSKPNYDIVLHIGMADTRSYYAVEIQAHRDNYIMEDVVGETLKGDTFWKEEFGSPEVLSTRIKSSDLLKKWKQNLPTEDLRLSDNAGRYLCEFIYYTSMVEYWRKSPGGDCPVVFLHVPGQADEAHVETGKQVVLSLISSLAEVTS